jgi:hypothetical protein
VQCSVARVSETVLKLRQQLATNLEGHEMEHRQLIVEIVAIFAAISAITSLIVISLNMTSAPLMLPWTI